MIEINLIPDVKQELLKAQRTRAVVISGSILTCIIAGGIVVLLVLYLGVQGIRGAIVDQAIEDGDAKLAKVEDLSKMLTIQNQLARINELNVGKKLDSRMFDVLAAIVPPAPNDVQISQFSVNDEDSTVTMEGQTRAYDSMEIFKKTIDGSVIQYTQDDTQKEIKLAESISVTDISYGENSTNQKVLRFTLTFKYPVELLAANIPVITIKNNVSGNVTDSNLGIPKSIFTTPAKDIE